jgi:hypothetical protein
MSNLKWTGLMAGALALGIASPALSHHSHAMYDHAKEVTISGTVTAFAYVNPHGSLDVAVADANGQPQKYWIEMSNLTNMVARKITPRTFKVGDKITIKMHPFKDGRRKGGSYTMITAADGKNYE